MSKLARAISMAAKGFEKVIDKSGQPYILHCLWVMNHCNAIDDDERIAAVLHDVIEDKVCTWEQIYKEKFSQKVIDLLVLLTHDKVNTSYEDYITAIAVSPGACRIKRADLRHNSDILRLKGVSYDDLQRIKKYHSAFQTLKGR